MNTERHSNKQGHLEHNIPKVLKDLRFVYPPDDNVMQCSGYIKAGLSRYDRILLEQGTFIKRKA
jgi:hypothetical protein